MNIQIILRFGSVVLLIGFIPFPVWGGPINGTVNGSLVEATGVYDDGLPSTVTSTTINISYFTSCYFITNGITAGGFGAYNFVFAGQGVAKGIANIDPSDFTIAQYNPWVVNNNATTNFITGPDSRNYNRNVTNQDAGGANIVISYTPRNASDPKNVNFLQAYIENTNNAGFTNGVLDNLGRRVPFYNQVFAAGTGTTIRTGTSPLVSSSTTPAWLVDIPYSPESGYGPNPVDEAINKETVTFQTFISSEQVISGTTYNVLYGGVQWGYTFTTVDFPSPEPSSLTLLGIGSFGLIGYGWRRRKRSA